MSIEQALSALAEAVTENTKAIRTLIETNKQSDAIRTELAGKAEAALKGGAAAPATKTKAAEKPAAETPPAEPEKPADDDGYAAAMEQAKKDATEFLGAATSTEDREARKVALKEKLSKLNVAKTSEIGNANDCRRLSKALAKLTEEFAAKAAGGSDDDDI